MSDLKVWVVCFALSIVLVAAFMAAFAIGVQPVIERAAHEYAAYIGRGLR